MHTDYLKKLPNIAVIVLALIVIAYTLITTVISSRSREIGNEIVNADFESGDIRGWTKSGNAFDYQPTFGDNPEVRNRESSNHQGKWWIGGFEKYQGKPNQKPGDLHGDKPTGTLTSDPFVIRGDIISFLIGGGNHPWNELDGTGSTCANLLVNDKIVRTATGSNLETMSRYVWDVSRFKNKSAVIQLVDANSSGWGHLNFDDIRQMTRWQAEKGNYILYLCFAGLLLIASLARKYGKIKHIWRWILALTGVLMLVLSAPQQTPWNMKYIQSSLADKTLIHLKFSLIHAELSSLDLTFSASALAKSLAVLFVGLILITPSARKCFRSLFRQPRRLIILLLAIGYLLFTLKPTNNGWSIVLYLIFGTVGIVMTLIGLSPLVDVLIRGCNGIGRRIYRRFCEIPAWLFLSVLFAFAFILTNLGSFFIFEHIPHIQDSIDQVFHGKIFLLGKLTVPSPEPREFFDFTHMINDGKWYSEYPPGHSLLMSFGHIFHVPWLINPLFGSLCVVLLYFIGKEIYSERIGRLSAVLGAISPFLIFMSSEFMNHTTMLFFVELFLLGFVRMMKCCSLRSKLRPEKRKRLIDAAVAGLALGYALNIRPLTAIAVGVPFAIYAIFKLIQLLGRSRKEMFRLGTLCLVALTMFAVMTGCLMGFNYLTNGDPFLFAYTVLHGEKHNPGFGHSGWGEPHTPQRGLTQTLNNLNALNKYLFEIPIPALIFAVLALASPKANVWDLLLIGYASSMSFAYFFYWFQDWCFGPRFMFSSTAAFVLLTARGITALPQIAKELFGIANERKVKGWIAVVLILCFSLGFASNLPTLVNTYSNNYWGVNGQVLKTVKKMELKNAVIFVKSYYGSVFAANSPLLNSDVIYVKELGKEKNAELMRKFPTRQFFIADGDSIQQIGR